MFFVLKVVEEEVSEDATQIEKQQRLKEAQEARFVALFPAPPGVTASHCWQMERQDVERVMDELRRAQEEGVVGEHRLPVPA